MKQEDKELLLNDLSARLPYGVKIKSIKQRADACQAEVSFTERLDIYTLELMMKFKNEDFPFFLNKPYLFPLSSMTEEQKNNCPIGETNLNIIKSNIGYGIIELPWQLSYLFIDWCNKNHFDYRSLIKKGLAIDASNLNIY